MEALALSSLALPPSSPAPTANQTHYLLDSNSLVLEQLGQVKPGTMPLVIFCNPDWPTVVSFLIITLLACYF